MEPVNACEKYKTTNNYGYLIQNFQMQIDTIPSNIQNLNYGIYPNDVTYNDVRLNYNKRQNIFPLALFYPRNETDISYLISNFATNNLNFAIRCGGHAYEPASLSNKYVVDVSKLEKKIIINDEKKTVKLSAGLLLGHVIEELSKYSFITPTGTSPCVGLSGLALAGGRGLLTRMYGLTSQNIVSIKMVNYKGDIMHVDLLNNPDLFWAIRGAGCGNFGVITEIELKVYNDIFMYSETLQWEWNPKMSFLILKLYQQQIIKYPKNITTKLVMCYNNLSAYISITFFSFNENLLYVNELFKTIGSPDVINKYSGHYSQCVSNWGDLETGKNGCFSKMKSTMIFKQISDKGINDLINSVELILKLKLLVNFSMNFSQLGGEVSNLKDEGCFAFKNAIMVLSYFAKWNDSNLTNQIIDYMNKIYKNNEKYLSIYCFPNFIDYDIGYYMEKYYGNNRKALINIKNKYDPDNVFNYRQSIPLI
jgi:hypothetical protein